MREAVLRAQPQFLIYSCPLINIDSANLSSTEAMGGAPVKNEKNIFWRYVQINEWLFELGWFRVQQVLWPYCRYLESVRSTSLKIVHERHVQIWVLEKNFFRSRIFRISRFIVWAIKFSPHQHGHHDHIDPFHYHLEKYHRNKWYS